MRKTAIFALAVFLLLMMLSSQTALSRVDVIYGNNDFKSFKMIDMGMHENILLTSWEYGLVILWEVLEDTNWIICDWNCENATFGTAPISPELGNYAAFDGEYLFIASNGRILKLNPGGNLLSQIEIGSPSMVSLHVSSKVYLFSVENNELYLYIIEKNLNEMRRIKISSDDWGAVTKIDISMIRKEFLATYMTSKGIAVTYIVNENVVFNRLINEYFEHFTSLLGKKIYIYCTDGEKIKEISMTKDGLVEYSHTVYTSNGIIKKMDVVSNSIGDIYLFIIDDNFIYVKNRTPKNFPWNADDFSIICGDNDRIYVLWQDEDLHITWKMSHKFKIVMRNEIHTRLSTENSYVVNISNIGGASQVIDVRIKTNLPEDWNVKTTSSTVHLPENEDSSFILIISAGNTLPKSGKIDILATSEDNKYNESVSVNVVPEISWKFEFKVSPSSIETFPREEVKCTLTVFNLGDISSEFIITSENVDNWEVYVYSRELSIEPKKTASSVASISPSEDAKPGIYEIKFICMQKETSKSKEVTLQISIIPEIILEMSIDQQKKYVKSGAECTFEIFLKNRLGTTKIVIVNLEVLSAYGAWEFSLDDNQIELMSMKDERVILTVKSPPDALGGERIVLKVRAYDSFGMFLSEVTAETIVKIKEDIDVDIGDVEINPGTTAVISMNVKNTGNAPIEISLDIIELPSAWSWKFVKNGEVINKVFIDYERTQQLSIHINIPDIFPSGIYNIKIRFRATNGIEWIHTVKVKVLQIYSLSCWADSIKEYVGPGEVAAFQLHVRNDGNGFDDVIVEVKSNWKYDVVFVDEELVPVENIKLESGDVSSPFLMIHVPTYARANEEIEVSFISLSGIRAKITLFINIVLPDIAVYVKFSKVYPSEGDKVYIYVKIVNRGIVPVKDVIVALYDNGNLLGIEKLSVIPSESEKTAGFVWIATPGDHRLSIRADPDDRIPESRESNNEFSTIFSVPEPSYEEDIIIISTAGIIGLTATMLAGAFATDNGKYYLYMLFFVPLYTKIKKEKMLDHFIRGQIYGYIKANPGEHYSGIKRALGLKNGTLIYHLKMLEKQEYIKSVSDGRFRRFYPKDMKIPSDDEEITLKMSKVQHIILNIIRENPGITQKDIATKVGISSATVNYHVSILMSASIIRVRRVGRITKCYVREDLWY